MNNIKEILNSTGMFMSVEDNCSHCYNERVRNDLTSITHVVDGRIDGNLFTYRKTIKKVARSYVNSFEEITIVLNSTKNHKLHFSAVNEKYLLDATNTKINVTILAEDNEQILYEFGLTRAHIDIIDNIVSIVDYIVKRINMTDRTSKFFLDMVNLIKISTMSFSTFLDIPGVQWRDGIYMSKDMLMIKQGDVFNKFVMKNGKITLTDKDSKEWSFVYSNNDIIVDIIDKWNATYKSYKFKTLYDRIVNADETLCSQDIISASAIVFGNINLQLLDALYGIQYIVYKDNKIHGINDEKNFDNAKHIAYQILNESIDFGRNLVILESASIYVKTELAKILANEHYSVIVLSVEYDNNGDIIFYQL